MYISINSSVAELVLFGRARPGLLEFLRLRLVSVQQNFVFSLISFLKALKSQN